MNRCSLCGAQIPDGSARCRNDLLPPGEDPPWAGDYFAMFMGQMSNDEHEIAVAQWVAHHPDDYTANVIKWARLRISRQSSRTPRLDSA
jgi:hypothetical protein